MKNLINMEGERIVKIEKEVYLLDKHAKNPFEDFVGIKKIRLTNSAEFELAQRKGKQIFAEIVNVPSRGQQTVYYIEIPFNELIEIAR